MKRNFVLLFFIFLIFSCKTVPEIEPLWLTDLNQAFPEKEYFAKLGEGISSQDAILAAQTELASYFSTNIKKVVESSNFMEEKEDGSVDKNKKLNVYSVSTTDLDFFAMEKTEAYYRKADKKWYAAVYINKAKAWSQYEPIVRDSMEAFYSIFNLSKSDDDPLRKIKIYKAAQEEGENFIGNLYKAVILSKERTEKVFGDARKTYSSIPGLIQKEKNRSIVYFDINEDFSGIIRSKINKSFSNLKFPVTETGDYSFYSVQIIIDYNQHFEEELIVMEPSLSIKISNKNEILYTYDTVLEKVLSYNLDKAKRTACSFAAEKIENEFENDFLLKTGIIK
ncbi:MAG: hypothetical protein K5829_01410 [Treponema sp.]|nr:hypothetical protein [Treponema sp.]